MLRVGIFVSSSSCVTTEKNISNLFKNHRKLLNSLLFFYLILISWNVTFKEFIFSAVSIFIMVQFC